MNKPERIDLMSPLVKAHEQQYYNMACDDWEKYHQQEMTKQKEEFLKVLEGLEEHQAEYYSGSGIRTEAVDIKRIDEAKEKFRLTTNNKGEKRC